MDFSKMTREQRIKALAEWNILGFEGDHHIENEVAKLIKEHGVDLILETGSFHGHTSKRFSNYCETHSCEISQANIRIAQTNAPGVTFYRESSPGFLGTMLAKFKDRSILCYLDAHGPVDTPLIQELEAIAASGVMPLIVIHDFKVPARTDLGFDSYHGQDYTWEWIEPYINAIYSKAKSVSVHYSTQASGAMRGTVYIQAERLNDTTELTTTEEPKKRVLSDAHKAAIAEGQRKRRAKTE